jgi:uncharacterized protein (TIGR00299 family) protein
VRCYRLKAALSALDERTVAVLDPLGGLAGDMLLGALLDLGVQPDLLRAQLASLGLPGWSLEVEPTTRRYLGCTKASFRVPEERGHRHLPEIRERIAASSLSSRAKQKADRTFCLLGEAEAAVHRIPVEQVHFHEVGAADAILDVCAVSLGLAALEIDEVVCGPLPGGSGTIHCEHGDMPVPAPAVVELLADFELVPGLGVGEMVTPTGMALLRAWGRPLHAGELLVRRAKAGYGAGTRAASILRLTVGKAAAHGDVAGRRGAAGGSTVLVHDEVCVLRTNLDDESPEALAWLAERLFGLGALDVAFAPLVMKKGRPGIALEAMVPPALRAEAVECILHESTALGVREQVVARATLPRTTETIEMRWGPVRIKRAGDRIKPEYEDLARIAREQGLPLHRVRAAVVAQAATPVVDRAAGDPSEDR